MDGFPPIAISALTGFFFGMIVQIPVGPINLTIINDGARHGFRYGLHIGLGAVLMESIYCLIAFTGSATFFSRGYVKAAMELISFLFLLYLGIKFLTAKSVAGTAHLIPAPTRFEENLEQRIEQRLHPHTAFMVGFVRVLGNPGVLVFWLILAANFISREWVEPTWPGKLSCVAGMSVGAGMWFTGLSWVVSRGSGRFSQRTLLFLERGCGLALLALAAVHGVRIVWQMARHSL